MIYYYYNMFNSCLPSSSTPDCRSRRLNRLERGKNARRRQKNKEKPIKRKSLGNRWKPLGSILRDQRRAHAHNK